MNWRTLLTLLGFVLAFPSCYAQGAGESIRVIIPLNPGTPSDSMMRLVASAMSEQLKRGIVIENKPGANGVIAVQELLRAKPDGNTLMLGGISPLALNVAVMRNLPYDPRRDFTPIGGMYNAFQAYVVSNSLPVNSLPELIEHAKKNAGKVSVGHYSALTKIQFSVLGKLTGVKFLEVPYKSTNTAYTDVISGTIDATLCDVATAISFARAGRLRILAITMPERNALAPGIPTAAETVPGLAVPAWSGLVGPRGVPKETVARLNEVLNMVLRQKETIGKMAEGGTLPWSTTPEDFAAHVEREIARWSRAAREAGIEPE